MLVDNTDGYLDTVKEFADKVGKADNLQAKLDYLDGYASARREEGLETRCQLFKDWAPQSFSFLMEMRQDGGEWQRWFNGGMLFHSAHDGGGNGGAPTFSVCLSPTDGWSIHT
jgi:hypothetical protein